MANKFVDIKSNFSSEIKNFSTLKEHLYINAVSSLDKSIDSAVDELKSQAKNIIQEQIKIQQKAPSNGADQLANPALNIPKSKNDIIKYVFGQDISKSDYVKKSVNPNTINDESNVFVIKDKRVKVYQSVSDSSTYPGEESRMKQRFVDGVFIDNATGKVYKVNPSAVKGIKLECSRTTGGTLDSDKKFDAYKNSQKMSRTKDDGSPFQRLAVWTIRQEDVAFAMRHAISVDDIVNRIMENDHDSAARMLNSINKGGEYDEALKKVDNLKLSKDLTPDVSAINDINKLIKNLKIEKRIAEKEVRYTLFSTYGDEADKNQTFFDALREKIFLWKIDNEEVWIRALLNGMDMALKSYDGKAKFVAG
jgi:hypothetical protein